MTCYIFFLRCPKEDQVTGLSLHQGDEIHFQYYGTRGELSSMTAVVRKVTKLACVERPAYRSGIRCPIPAYRWKAELEVIRKFVAGDEAS